VRVVAWSSQQITAAQKKMSRRHSTVLPLCFPTVDANLDIEINQSGLLRSQPQGI